MSETPEGVHTRIPTPGSHRKLEQAAPYGGIRGDVRANYPDVSGSGESGFSLAFAYSNLGYGEHTITARAFNSFGDWRDSQVTFNVATFDKKFIDKRDVVEASAAEITSDGDEIYIKNIFIVDQNYDLTLKWRTQEQGFEIVDIR